MALELGPCDVAYGTSGSETSLGKTSGGVTVTIKDDSVDLLSDQYGSSPEDTIITGTTVEVSMALAEITMETLASILQPQQTTSATDAMAGLNKVALSLLANAQSLLLTKYVDGAASTDVADTIIFPAAAPVGDVELAYDASNQRVLNATFKCFPGTVNNLECLYYFGDEAAIFA
jgi:hypothetical protein